MHLRISTLVCCAILFGFAIATQTPADKSYYTGEEINIDANDDLEGSGGGTEFTGDLESSGSGYGDDEDFKDTRHPDPPRRVEPTEPPRKTVPEVLTPEENIPRKPSYPDLTVVMNPKTEDRPTFFAQPGILAAVIGGAVVGLLCAILVVMFIVYRMRKKDEGSYPLDEPKRSPTATSYNRGNSKEFFA